MGCRLRSSEDANGFIADATAQARTKVPIKILLFREHAARIDGCCNLCCNTCTAVVSPRRSFDRKEDADPASSERGRVERMAEALEAWQKSVIGSLNGEDY